MTSPCEADTVPLMMPFNTATSALVVISSAFALSCATGWQGTRGSKTCGTPLAPNAKELICEGGTLDFATIDNLERLETIVARSARLSSLDGVARASNLKRLELHQIPVDDLGPLASNCPLVELRLMDTQVTDLAPLANCPNMTHLEVHGSAVTDLSALRDSSNLLLLNLKGTEVKSVEPLSGLTSLVTLGLRDTKVADLRPISRLPALEVLDVLDSEVADPSPLITLPKLQVFIFEPRQMATLKPLRRVDSLLAVGVPFDRPSTVSKRYMYAMSLSSAPDITGRALDSIGDGDRSFKGLRQILPKRVTIYKLDLRNYDIAVIRRTK